MIGNRGSKLASLLLLLLLLLLDPASGRVRTENRFERLRGSDSIQVTRCDVVCYGRKDRECHRRCMAAPFVKHGRCPDSFSNVSYFVQACVKFCSRDVDCPSTEKCCEHSCQHSYASTCKPVDGLEEDADLPPVPQNVTASKKKGVYLSWTVPEEADNQLVLYVLQERHHLGAYFNKLLLGEWTPIHSTRKTSVTLKSVLKPGHFYQFRVAAVNVNGSKGFSEVSKGFTLARPPKLQKPKQLRVEEVRERNGTVSATVRWRPSKSPVPIEKYKVFWSFKLDETEFKYNSDSVLTQRTTVPEHKQSYQLQDLLKNKMYYIQVQAIASYGRRTLKSDKAQMLFDTSKLVNQYQNNPGESRKNSWSKG